MPLGPPANAGQGRLWRPAARRRATAGGTDLPVPGQQSCGANWNVMARATCSKSISCRGAASVRTRRPAVGKTQALILVPVLVKGQFVIPRYTMAYSETPWPWSYIDWLEEDPQPRSTGAASRWRPLGTPRWPTSTGKPPSINPRWSLIITPRVCDLATSTSERAGRPGGIHTCVRRLSRRVAGVPVAATPAGIGAPAEAGSALCATYSGSRRGRAGNPPSCVAIPTSSG
ncbi:hypothetical protein ACPA9J_19470 [Pseudomonas aeruginosa]